MKAKTFILAIIALCLTQTAYAVSDEYLMDLIAQQPAAEQLSLVDVNIMTADLLSMYKPVNAKGKLLAREWYDSGRNFRQSFVTNVAVAVPSKVPGLGNMKEAMNADLRIRVARDGIDIAECLLTVQPITSRTYVYFKVDIAMRWDDVKPNVGACDINLEKEGIQLGIPALQYNDLIATYVMGEPLGAGEFDFMEGYCK